MTNKTNAFWAENLQKACKEAGIETAKELNTKLSDVGLKVNENTAWHWYAGKRKPKTAEQYKALDKVLGLEYSEKLFFFKRD